MSQTAINFAIESAFQSLAKKSWDLFDTWYDRLHNVRIEGDIEHSEEIESEWNATNLDLMLADVMSAAWLRLCYTDPLSRGVIKYTLPSLTVHYSFYFIMSLSVALSLLAQGNNGDEILTILDTLVSDIEQEGINSCAEVFEVWM